MIVGVAGHIDHGKTSLVRALTGVDTDRLPEEKARGISIDIGFAYRHLPGGATLAFVDMPGHEKFIRNMVAGASGIECAILVVAADDGIKPQTLEHLIALELLGVRRCVAVVTKADRVTAERVFALSTEVAHLLCQSGMDTAPVLPVSVREMRGLDALESWLVSEAQRQRTTVPGAKFRLAIDRFFKLDGHGPVVTGTVWAGEARVGDKLTIAPSGVSARVRRIHAGGEPADVARAGQRCALNVAGPGVTETAGARGNWIIDPALDCATTEIDVRLRLAGSAPRAMPHWSLVQLHLGAGSAEARVVLLDCAELEPGGQALARLVTTERVMALHGDRFLIRDPSSRRVIGGGTVLDPFAPSARRRKAERAGMLRTLEAATPASQLAALLQAAPGGVDMNWFALVHNCAGAQTPALREAVPSLVVVPGAIEWGFAGDDLARLEREAVAATGAFLQADPARKGVPDHRLRQQLGLTEPGFQAVIGGLLHDQKLIRVDGMLSLPGHSPDLTRADQLLIDYLSGLLSAAPFAPVPLAGLPAALEQPEKEVIAAAKRLSRLRRLVFIDRDLVILADSLSALARLAEDTAARDGDLSLAAFRAACGVGRNHAVTLLEHFDRQGFTKRSGAGRVMARKAALVFPQTAGQESG